MNNLVKFTTLFFFFTSVFELVFVNIPHSVKTLVLGVFVLMELNRKREFSAPIIGFVLCIFLSCISSYVFRGQHNIYTTFTQSFTYLSLAFYFVCLRLKISISDLEKSLVFIGLVSVGGYILQYEIYPTALFHDALKDYDKEIRVRMCGSIIYSFLFFFGVNKYVTKKTFKYILYSALSFICIAIMGFRSLTISLLAIGLMEYLYLTGLSAKRLKQLIPLVVVIVVVSQLDIVTNKFLEMLSRQESGQSFDNDDYIRFVELDYYWNNYFTNNIERFFGSGLPVMGTDLYNLQRTNFMFNLYWNDWGLLGLSWIYGIPAVCLLYFLYLKVIFSKIPKDYIYLKAIFIFLILTSLTSAEAFRSGNLLLQGAFLYLVMKVKNNEEKLHG